MRPLPRQRRPLGDVSSLTLKTRPRNVLVSLWYHFGMAFTLRTDETLDAALSRLSEAEGLSRQEVIRRAVLDRCDLLDHQQRISQSTEKMIERWGDVLDRLGAE